MNRLPEEKQQEFDKVYQMIISKYGNQIKAELSPLPAQLLTELGERALQFGTIGTPTPSTKRSKNWIKKLMKYLEKQFR